jgi:hypothetical protein
MKIGDRILCINSCDAKDLTVGKTYKVVRLDRDGDPLIINDSDIEWRYYGYRFKVLTREKKLERILKTNIKYE